MPVLEIKSFTGLSDYEDRGIKGAFKFGKNLDVRKERDTLSAGQALTDEGLLDDSNSPSASPSPSASVSPSLSASLTPSPSASRSPSVSTSASQSASSGISPSPSLSSSASASPSASVSPSSSISLSPSASGGLTSVFSDLIHTFVKSSDGFTYGFGNTGQIYRRDESGTWIRVYKDSDGAILGAAEWYQDDGTTYLFWATAQKLKKKAIPGNSIWNDVQTVSTNLTPATWHTMREAGGALVIANASFLAMVGYDGSFTNEALNLIPGNIANTIIERNGRTIVGTAKANAPTKGVNGAIDTEIPLAQIGTDGQIFFSNMSDTVPVKRFPGGGRVNPGGVANEIDQIPFFEWEQNALSWIDKQDVGNMALFGVYNATSGTNGIYTYGRKNKNKPFVLNLEYEMDVDEIGAVTNVSGTTLASYRDGSSFGVKAVDPNNKATAVYEGLDFVPPTKGVDKITPFEYVKLQMFPLPSGCSVEFWYKRNKTGDFKRANLATGALSASETNLQEAVFRLGMQCKIYEPKLILNPSGNNTPEIYWIGTFFK